MRFFTALVACVASVAACARPSSTQTSAAPSVVQQGAPAAAASVAAPPKDTTRKPRADSAALPPIAEATKRSRRHDGLFTLYQDTTTGATTIAVSPRQLDREFVYFTHVLDAPAAAGLFRGAFGESRVFSIHRRFNRLEFVIQNANFWFDPASPLARSADANISSAVADVQDIVARDSATGTVLVKADGLFLTEALVPLHAFADPNTKPGTSFSLGQLSAQRSRYIDLRNYPANTDVIVEYVFENPNPVVDPAITGAPALGGREVTDPRVVSVRVEHSLIAMPTEPYTARKDDPRIGYFTQQITDMTSTSATPYHDLITRWRLVKKDPNAAISEPVEPIVWWIENTTPHELRGTIRDAALTWNAAFEAAGFRNALVVNEQPDNAEWDAGDIRYNVLRWTSSPNPQFGGYGPSFANPRTGQMIGADVMLEFVFITNRLNQEKLFTSAALPMPMPMPMPGAMVSRHGCEAGLYLQQQALFGLQALRTSNASELEVKEYIRQSVHYLVIHELGHTLGLNHNMKASQMLSPAELTDRATTERMGVTGSIMDYPMVNLAPPGERQGLYFPSKPGPYDVWAIQYGYAPAAADSAAEKARVDALLARSTERALMFGNDADDMRSPGGGIDPRVMINDMSNDMIAYSTGRMKRVDEIMRKVPARYTKPGQSYHELRNAYLILTGQIASAADAVSRYVGGVYVDRSFAGQPGAASPLTPVSRADQQRAMTFLRDYIFAPAAFAASDSLFAKLQMQRRGFEFFGTTEDPKIHERALTIQRGVLTHLTSPVVLARISDAELYGNRYPIPTMLEDLTAAIFDADMNGKVNDFRQNLQLEYTQRLLGVAKGPGYVAPARAAAFANLRRIEQRLRSRSASDAGTRAHTEHLLYVIGKGLEVR